MGEASTRAQTCIHLVVLCMRLWQVSLHLWHNISAGTVIKHVNDKPAPLAERSAVNVPADLESVIMKCLEKDPDNRYNWQRS